MQWPRTSTMAIVMCSLLLATASFAQQKLDPNIYRASQVIEADVKNPQGEKLGDIEDIVIDRQTGRVQYAVLSFGGFLGLGEKYFAVPWEALKPEMEQQAGQQAAEVERYVLNVDKERLKNAPGFERNNWPNMADRSWAEQIYAFYGVKPHWKHQEAKLTGTQGMQHSATINATVQNVDQSAQRITIKTSNDKTVDLQAPAEMLTTLQAGDRVEVVIRKDEMARPSATGQSGSEPISPGSSSR